MTALARAGWRTLTLEEFARRVTTVGEQHAAPLHSHCREFLLSFDDGYDSLATHAYPVVADLGFTATTFLITDYVGKTNTWDARYTWQRLPHLSWTQVEAWRARGFDFASHGATHRRLTWLDANATQYELERSREALRARLGPAAGKAIAYPFGAVDQRVLRQARKAGYEIGFGGVKGTGNSLHLARVPVYFWDFGDVPFGLRRDMIGTLGRFVAHTANRCAVGTSLINATRRTEPLPESAAGA